MYGDVAIRGAAAGFQALEAEEHDVAAGSVGEDVSGAHGCCLSRVYRRDGERWCC